MRNLRNIKCSIVDFGEDSAPLSATAWDPSDDSLICAFGPTEISPLLSLRRLGHDAYSPEDAVAIASWDALPPNPDLPYDRILDIHCFPDTRTIVLVLAGGDIVVVREETQPGEDAIEIVGSVDEGIAAASWSADEELLVIATNADTLLFMTRDFESTANIALSPEDVKISDHVSVGWGKAETQFKGRGAKAMRDPTVPEHVDAGTLSSTDNGKVSISWRGDGQFVAVNAVLKAESERRIIRVYSREGMLESVSEAVDGLEGALSWKPSGQLIAGIQRKSDAVDVVFFERNGLRHGEFSLRLTKDELDTAGSDIYLSWNVDSSVLAVSFKDRVQLWTMGNYHYYLKQEVFLNNTNASSLQPVWHPEKSLQLACASEATLQSLAYVSTISAASSIPPEDLGIVAAIDGQELKITPLKTANVPPPMAFDEVELHSNALDVAFAGNGTEFAVLHRDQVAIYECDYSTRPSKRAKLSRTVKWESRNDSVPRQIVASSEAYYVVLTATPNQTASSYTVVGTEGKELSCIDLPKPITTLFARSDRQRICCGDSDGTVYTATADSDLFLDFSDILCSLPSACPEIDVWTHEDQNIVVALAANGMLHVKSDGQNLRIAGCTSYLVTYSHLIYTTTQHLLKFIHLHDGQLEVPPDEPEKDERCRNVERGAKLVAVMPSAYSLVLQMPRGNLETIYPRALVLAGIRQSINVRDYKKAFFICRTQRVDMNILHDYAPDQFMQDVELFVKQVRKIEYLDLFLSSLSEENVAATIYKETLQGSHDASIINGVHAIPIAGGRAASSKTNTICDAFLRVLQGQSSTYLQTIVTAHVCKSPPDLEGGLRLISELRSQGNEDRLQQAVEHICFLADVNQLYETALGLYDLDVALLVAQQSQKDPREYLPYLQSLHDMEPLRRQYSVDNDLKRYKKALTHLHALGVFDELKAYMARHELYAAVIELYRYDNSRLQELMRLYAGYLCSRNQYKEAGIAYEYVQDYSSAYDAYRSANMWREALASAALVPVPDEELTSLAQDLADSLEEAKDHGAAAIIYQDYLHDLKTALKLKCKAYQFVEATRQAALHKRPELLTEVIDNGLVDGSAVMTELLAEMKGQINAQVPRLRELRQKKAEDPMAFLDGGEDAGGDVPDNLSVAPTDASTSGGTFMTRYTNRSTGTLATNATRKTSRNRRREERKRARGKKGTVYEEEYLVNSISRLVERLNQVAEEVTRLVEGLMRRAMRERAVAVEAAMLDVMNLCKDCVDEVFESQKVAQAPQAADQAMEDGEMQRPWGGEGVLWDALAASTQKKEAPVLKAFESLTLLAK